MNISSGYGISIHALMQKNRHVQWVSKAAQKQTTTPKKPPSFMNGSTEDIDVSDTLINRQIYSGKEECKMIITVLHGQNHKGSTYNITKLFLDIIADENTQIQEFYFVKNDACLGCFQCFLKGEEFCPHYAQVHSVIEAIEQADLVVIESPCYCLGMTGQLKSFLDHMGYRWMPHRPHASMFAKVGLCVSTAAGAGAKKVTKDLKQHMFFWGIPCIFKFSYNVGASSWKEVSPKKRMKIEKAVRKIAAKIRKKIAITRPPLSTKALFYFIRMNQKKNEWNKTDKDHWQQNGWLGKKRPWNSAAE